MAEALAAIKLLEPAFRACAETYGFYKLTKNFGQDYQKAERGLRGQVARLKLIGETRINDLLSVPEDGTQLAATTLWTLQGMRNNIELCELLMKNHGEPRSRTKIPSTSSQTPSIVSSGDAPQSPSIEEKKLKNKLFSRRHKSTSSASSSLAHSISASATEASNSSATSPSIFASLHDPKVTQGIHNDSLQVISLQSSSSLLGRLKWASGDRSQFFSAVGELTKANDLLESLLKIKSLEDPTFLPSVTKINRTTAQFLLSTRSSLESLSAELLKMNPQQGRDVEFALKLVLDDSEKQTYAPHMDPAYETNSSVFNLQAHSKSLHGNNEKAFSLLVETPIPENVAVPEIIDIVRSFKQIDPDIDSAFDCLGQPFSGESRPPKLRIYQDRTSEWYKARTLENALNEQKFHDILFQKHYCQLGLFIAFSYAVLPFSFRGNLQFPQPSNYSYYDQFSTDTSDITIDPEDGSQTSNIDAEEAFKDLLSVYINYSLGSRPPINTKALGKRPGYTAAAHNPTVALGILLYQIGSWRQLPAGDITQMKRDALDRSHDLIRLAGVEFADITRTCLNWTEVGKGGKIFDSEEMLVKVYARLDEYNKSLQAHL